MWPYIRHAASPTDPHVTRSTTALREVRDTLCGRDRFSMGGVTLAPSAISLITGDDELLVSRAVSAAIEAVRAADAGVESSEVDAGATNIGELAELLSPSLFGTRRVVVVRRTEDAKKDV